MNSSIKVRRLKRITLTIRNKKFPNQVAYGQAVVQDIGRELFYFFTTQKFLLEEDLEVSCEHYGEKYVFILNLHHIHEEISSGRIMNAIPEEGKPFPAIVFYRCFAKVKSRKVLEAPVAATLSVVPDMIEAKNTVETKTEIKPEDALAAAMKSMSELEQKVA